MDLSALLAARRKIADASAISSEGTGSGSIVSSAPEVSATSRAANDRATLLSLGAQPPRPSSDFAGLMNQGATCYLNSLIQVMFCASDLRKALYGV